MTDELLQQIILNLPNFTFALVAILALLTRLRSQDKTISLLINYWRDCEQQNDTREMLKATKQDTK